MIREYGLPVMKEALLDEVSSMCELLGAEMNETQLTYLLDFVAEKYKYFTISDLTIITRKMVAEKVYHKPSMQSFICAFEAHDLERDEHASIEQQKKQFKDEKETDEGIKAWRKNYSALYVKAQKKKRPEKQIRKEKDVEARQLNKERIEEMKKLYPDDMITSQEEIEKINQKFLDKLENLE